MHHSQCPPQGCSLITRFPASILNWLQTKEQYIFNSLMNDYTTHHQYIIHGFLQMELLACYTAARATLINQPYKNIQENLNCFSDIQQQRYPVNLQSSLNKLHKWLT